MSQSTTPPTRDDARSTTTHPTPPENTERSWVDLCQRQFGSATRPLPNLVDDENTAIYDGV